VLVSNRVGNVVITPTEIIGIYVVREEFSGYPDEYWISDDHGGEKHFGHNRPTSDNVQTYWDEAESY
jgi:hypothetical protein